MWLGMGTNSGEWRFQSSWRARVPENCRKKGSFQLKILVQISSGALDSLGFDRHRRPMCTPKDECLFVTLTVSFVLETCLEHFKIATKKEHLVSDLAPNAQCVCIESKRKGRVKCMKCKKRNWAWKQSFDAFWSEEQQICGPWSKTRVSSQAEGRKLERPCFLAGFRCVGNVAVEVRRFHQKISALDEGLRRVPLSCFRSLREKATHREHQPEVLSIAELCRYT